MTSNEVSLYMIDQLERIGTMTSDHPNNLPESDSLLVSSLTNHPIPRAQKTTSNNQSRAKYPGTLPVKSSLQKASKPAQQYNNKQNHTKDTACSQNCSAKIEKLQQQIQQMDIKLQNVQINQNISFTKHMETANWRAKQLKAIENIQYTQWAVQTKVKQFQEKVKTQVSLLQRKNAHLQSQIGSLRFNRQEGESGALISLDYSLKGLQQRMGRQKQQVENRLQRIMEVIKDMGILQRRILVQYDLIKSKTDINRVNMIPSDKNIENTTIIDPYQGYCSCLLRAHQDLNVSQPSTTLMESMMRQCTKSLKK